MTRDELIARCWEGRIVGDNAIQRTISRLRDIAAGFGEGCFRLETVSKVGYRLIAVSRFYMGDAAEGRRLLEPVVAEYGATEHAGHMARFVFGQHASAKGLLASVLCFQGFYDQDFTANHYTAKGIFLRFRFKFDQDTIKELAMPGRVTAPPVP